MLRVVTAGVATSLQDRGRPGYAASRRARVRARSTARRADLVNRLVGNPPDAAVLETAGGLVLEAIAAGRRRRLDDGRRAGARRRASTLAVDPAAGELWAYLAVRGGFAVEPVLGSRSWDSLSSSVRRPPRAGRRARAPGRTRAHRRRRPGTPPAGSGNRRDPGARRARAPTGSRRTPSTACSAPSWTVAADRHGSASASSGPAARPRRSASELPSEGLVTGAIQVPPDGQPVVMLADHPTTGGYPVIAVVDEGDLGRARPAPAGFGRALPALLTESAG